MQYCEKYCNRSEVFIAFIETLQSDITEASSEP